MNTVINSSSAVAPMTATTFAIVLLILLNLPGYAQEPVDIVMAARIQEEGQNRSRVMDHAFYLTDVHGPRLTGSPGFKKAAAWALQRLQEIGLSNVHAEPIPWGRGWSERDFSISLVQPHYARLTAVAVPWSRPTNGVVEAEPILAPLPSRNATSEDYEVYFQRHRGKLQRRFVLASPALPRPQFVPGRLSDEEFNELRAEHERKFGIAADSTQIYEDMRWARQSLSTKEQVDRFMEAEGALGILYSSFRSGGTVGILGRIQTAHERNPMNIPPPATAVLGWEDYNHLVRLVEKGIPVRLRMKLNATFHDDPDAASNILAEIPGIEKPDEIVLLGAHFDSWTAGTGATDNAAGCAVVIEAMRILKTLDIEPKRTIRMALWGGHEGAGLGARSYIRDHLVEDHPLSWLDALPGSPIRRMAAYEKLSAYYNLDYGPGQIRGIYTERIDGIGPIFNSWFRPFGDYGKFFVINSMTGGTDNDEFNAVGLPGFQFVQDRSEFGVHTHHSNMDLFDYLSEIDLQRSAIILAFFAYQTAMRDELLPRGKVPLK